MWGAMMTAPSPAFWAGKRVLLTGHTGFKGGWAAIWLHLMGAEVTGLALPPDQSPDPAVLAAKRFASPRVHVIDMTRFICNRRRCFPVVGGVLVHKDIGHLTRLFSTTLGPFVLRALNRLR